MPLSYHLFLYHYTWRFHWDISCMAFYWEISNLTIDIFRPFVKYLRVFGLSLFWCMGWAKDEQLPELHPGATVSLSPVVVYGFCGYWPNIFSKFSTPTWTFSTIPKGQGWMSTQIEGCDLLLWECGCASHASRSPNKEFSCASVPHGTGTVCNCRFVFYSSCDGPEAVGEIQDCHCSL